MKNVFMNQVQMINNIFARIMYLRGINMELYSQFTDKAVAHQIDKNYNEIFMLMAILKDIAMTNDLIDYSPVNKRMMKMENHLKESHSHWQMLKKK